MDQEPRFLIFMFSSGKIVILIGGRIRIRKSAYRSGPKQHPRHFRHRLETQIIGWLAAVNRQGIEAGSRIQPEVYVDGLPFLIRSDGFIPIALLGKDLSCAVEQDAKRGHAAGIRQLDLQ